MERYDLGTRYDKNGAVHMVCVCLYMCDINDLLALHAGMYVIYYMHRYATMQRMRVLQIYLSQASHLAEL